MIAFASLFFISVSILSILKFSKLYISIPFCLFLVFVLWSIRRTYISPRKLFYFTFFLSLLISLSILRFPTSDAYALYASAKEEFVNCEYFQAFPYQLPLRYLFRLFFFLFQNEYIVLFFLYLIMCLSAAVIVYFIARLAKKLFPTVNPLSNIILIIFSISISFAAPFLYGTLPSMALCCAAIYFFFKFESDKKPKHPLIIISLSSICLVFSYEFKQQSLVVIAVLLLVSLRRVYLTIQKKQYSKCQNGVIFIVFSLLLLVLLLPFNTFILNNYENKYCEGERGKGFPFITTIAVGLSTVGEEYGTYKSGHRSTSFYRANGIVPPYDNNAINDIKKINISYIKQQSEEIFKSPYSAIKFYGKKYIDAFRLPSFGILEDKIPPENFAYNNEFLFSIKDKINLSNPNGKFEKFTKQETLKIIYPFLYSFQLLIFLFGAIGIFIYRRKISLIFCMVFLFFNVFILVFEIQPLYIIYGFVFISTYSPLGFNFIVNRLKDFKQQTAKIQRRN